MGRLNEELKDCTGRYGDVIKEGKIESGDPYTIHAKAGFQIMVTYHKGKAAMIFMAKAEKDELGTPLPISDDEIKKILRNNNQGKDWTEGDLVWLHKCWATDAMIAQYSEIEHGLTLVTKAYSELLDKRKKEKDLKNLEGF